MNKIFKVLWNKVRATSVVTDEAKTAHGKGRQGVLSTTLGAATATGAASLLFVLSPMTMAASTITPGWNNTTVSSKDGVHNITTNAIQGTVGINKFDRFEIVQKEIANLQFGSANKLLNFVNQQIKVDGTVNAVKDNKIGGDLYFISPQGMVVGSTGVINAGSLSVATPKQSTYDEWLTQADTPSMYADRLVDTIDSGHYAINPAGIITVNGSINAGNRIALRAKEITVGSTGALKTGVDDFANLVNIKNGTATVSAGLDPKLEFSVDSNSGDIILAARAEVESAGIISESKKGSTYQENVQATITVEKGGTVTAQGNIKATAEAGNGEYDLVKASGSDKEGDYDFKVNEATQSYNVTATVTINGTLTAGGDIDLKAHAFNLVDNSFGFNLATITEQAGGGFANALFGSTVAYADADAVSKVVVGESGVVQAQNGSVNAEAITTIDLNVGDSTAVRNLNKLGSVKEIPTAAVAVVKANAQSNVEIQGRVQAQKDITLKAHNDFTVLAETKAQTLEGSNMQVAVVVGDFASNSDVTIGKTAKVGAADADGSFGSLKVEAGSDNRVETSAEAIVYSKDDKNDQSGTDIGFAVNWTEFDSDATVNIGTAILGTAGSVDIDATNTTETVKIHAKTTVGDKGFLMKGVGALTGVALGSLIKASNEAAGGSASGVLDSLDFNVGGALGYIKSHQGAEVNVAGNIETSGTLTIVAQSLLNDHHYEAITKQVIDDNANGQGAASILIAQAGDGGSASAVVNVADGVTLDATQVLQIRSDVSINKNRFPFLISEIEKSFDSLAQIFTKAGQAEQIAQFNQAKQDFNDAVDMFQAAQNDGQTLEAIQKLGTVTTKLIDIIEALSGFATENASALFSAVKSTGFDILDLINPASWVNGFVSAGGVTSKASNSPISLAGSVAVLNQSTKSHVNIGSQVKISGQSITLGSESNNESTALGGFLDNFLGIPLPQRDNSKSAGGTVVYQNVETDTSLTVREGTTLTAKDDIIARTNDAIDAVTVAATAGINKGGVALSGFAAVTNAIGKNVLSIDDEVNFTAGDAGKINIFGQRYDNIQTIAGGLTLAMSDGSNAAMGVGIAVNLGGVENSVAIEDNDEESSTYKGDAGTFKAGSIAVNAGTDLTMNAIGVAGEAAASTSGGSTGSGQSQGKNATGVVSGLNSGGGSSMTSAIGKIQGATSDALAQNSATDLENRVQSQQSTPSAGSAAKPDIGTSQGKTQAGQATQSSGFNLAGAGSFAWNDFGSDNAVRIVSNIGDYTFSTKQLNVESLTNKWVGAFAGAAGIAAAAGQNKKQANVGIGGAVAVNNGAFANTVTIGNLKTTASTINIHSLVNGSTVAEGLGVAVAAGQSNVTVGIDAGVSVNLLENTVAADVTGLKNEASQDALVLDLAAWSGETQVTGGTSVGVAVGSTTASAAVGASVAVADINNKISATLNKSTLVNANQVNVKALASLTQVNTAVGANVAQSSGSASVAISGAVISAGINNIVSAQADDTSISTVVVTDKDKKTTNPQVAIVASDAGTDKGEAAYAYAQLAKGMEGVFDVSGKTPMTGDLLKDLNLQTSDNEKDQQNINTFIDDADMTQVSVAVGVGVSVSGGSGVSASGSAGVLVTDFTNSFTANSTGLTVQSTDAKGFDFVQKAISGVSTVNVSAGVAAAAGGDVSLGVSGSVVVGGINQTAKATAKRLTLDAKTGQLAATIAAANKAHTVNVAGNVTAAISAAGAGAGAAVVVTNISNTAQASVEKSSVSAGSGETDTLTVSAENSAESWDAAANAAVAANAAIGGAFALNNVSNNALAHVADTTLTLLDAMNVEATDNSELWTLAGSVAANIAPGASLSGGIAVTNAGGTTQAQVESLALIGNASAPKVDITVNANANDQIKTLTLGVAAGGGHVLSNATAINKVKRSVEATLSGLNVKKADDTVWDGTRQLGSVTVQGRSNAQISNLGIMAGVGTGAAGGLGFAQNTVAVDVSATGSEINAALDTLNVAAASANDIDTIGIGMAGGGSGAIGGSTADNVSGGNVEASLANSKFAASGAVAVHAESDDTIGTYSGQATAGGSAAAGISVAFSERNGTTSASMINSEITETNETSSTLKINGGVADSDINQDVVENVSTGATLADKRQEQTVSGIHVGATSTTTFKTLAINAALAGSAAGAGSSNSVTHGGVTSAAVKGSTLTSETGNVSVFAGDYANAFTSLTSVGVAGTATAAIGASLVDSEHQTTATIDTSTVTADDVSLTAESKEGFSSLLINGGAAMTVAGAATASDVNQSSGVATALTNSTVEGENYTQKADYFGSIANLGINAALSTTAAVGANVALNTNKATVSSLVDNSHVNSTDTVDVTAHRQAKVKQYGATASGSSNVAAAAAVVVNNMGGEATVKVSDDSSLGAETSVSSTQPDSETTEVVTTTTEKVNVAATNDDNIDIVSINASVGFWASAGATVVVNKINGAAGTRIENSSVTANDVSVTSAQNRTIKGTVVTASGSLIASLGANIVATSIGQYQGDYATLLGGKEVQGNGSDPAQAVENYENGASGLTTSDLKKSAQGYQSDSATPDSVQTRSAQSIIDDLSGTQTQLVGATITAKKNANVSALEDANGTGVNLTLGSGNAGAVSLGAGVATLTRNHNAGVTVSGGKLSAETLDVSAKLGSKDDITVWQASAGLAAGAAAYAEVNNQGGVAVRFTNGAEVASSAKTVNDALQGTTGGAVNASSTKLDVNGIAAGVVAAGAMIGKINDASHVTVEMNGAKVTGQTSLVADRGQTLDVAAFAGYGGALAGVGASSQIVDSGTTTVSLVGVTTENAVDETDSAQDNRLTVDANSHANMTVEAGAAGGALGVAVGIVEGIIKESGKVSYTVTDSQFNTSEVSLTGALGTSAEALTMDGSLAGYGGALLGAGGANTLDFTNTAKVDFNLSGTNFGTATQANLFAGGNAVYNGKSDAIYAGAVASGSSKLEVNHGVDATMNLTGTNAVGGLINANVNNVETVTMLGESAGGGLIAAESLSGDALRISHTDTSNARINVAGSWHTAGSINFATFSQSILKLSADNTKGGLGAFSGASVINHQSGESKVLIKDGASVKSDENLLMSAKSDWSVGAVDGNSHVVNSEVYGGVAGTGIKYEGVNSRSNIVEVGNAKLDARDSLSAEAFSQGKTDIRVKSTVGALAGVAVQATLTQDLDITNKVDLKSGANLRTRLGDGVMVLAASANDDFYHEAVSDFSGAIGGKVGSTTNIDYVRKNAVDVVAGANILAGGELYLSAGENAARADAYLLGIHRAEVFAKAGLALPEASLTLNTTLSNTVNIAGDALSVASAVVNADSGWWLQQTDSLSHYWGSLGTGNTVNVAQKADGKNSPNMHETNELTVSGTLEAGVLTGVDITIDGIIGLEGFEIEGENVHNDLRDALTVKVGKDDNLTDIEQQFRDEILNNITVAEQEAKNDYWNRYNQLQKLIADYTRDGVQSNQDAVTAYRSELEGLQALMLQKGFAYKDGSGTLVPIQSQQELVVKVQDIAVSGGSIEIKADSVKGNGSIKANAVDGVSITNNSNANLNVGNIHIHEKGGDLFFNGATANSNTFVTAGFTGTVTGQESSDTPAINIKSEYTGNSFVLRDGQGSSEVVNPVTNITVSGDIENLAGDLSIKAVDGNLLSLAGITSSGKTELSAGGSVMQSYTAGVTEIGGKIQGNSTWAQQLQDMRINLQNGLINGTGSVHSNAMQDTSGSAIVAGGQIIISGEMINLNGLVQSGFSKYEIALTDDQLASQIAQVKKNCTGICTLVKGGAVKDGNTYKYQIGLSYDTVNDRLILDDVTPTGGNVYISGKIASTGGGSIYAVDGTAYVNIDAANYDIQTGKISTGNAAGLVKITDTFKANGNTAAVVTEYQSGNATTYAIDAAGNTIGNVAALADASKYDPKSGLLYVWTEGYSFTTRKTQVTTYEGKWWGEPKWSDITPGPIIPETSYDPSMSSGGTITDKLVRPDGAGSQDVFYAWNEKITLSEKHTQQDTGVWSTGFLGFYKHRVVTDIWESGGKAIGTYTVKADQSIKVGVLKDANANTINLRGKNVYIGGSLTTDSGTVGITAKADIASLGSTYSIAGTSHVNLVAGGNIGSDGNAIKMTGGAGTLNLSAQAGGNIYLDARSLNSGRDVKASLLDAGGTLSLATRNAMYVEKLRGNDITLTSDNNGITVKDLVQGKGNNDLADQTYRFDASARGDINVTVTEGSLGLGLVETGADVVLTLNDGTLYDAVKTDQNTVSDNDRLQSWIASGLIDAEGNSRSELIHEENVKKQTTAVESEFTRYESYKDYLKVEGRKLTDQQQSDYDALNAKYQNCASAEEAVKLMANTKDSALYKVMNETLDSWTANDLLYSVASTIVNGTATPTTGNANIVARNVTIRTPSGSVGSVDDPVTGRLNGTAEERLKMLQYLSKADVGDFSVSGNEVTVTLKAPITIGATGNVNIESSKSVFIETPREGGYGFNIDQIVSKTGDVRVTSGNGIFGINDGTAFISATKGTVTLRGGTSSVGSEAGTIHIHSGDWTAVSSQSDIFIESVDEANQKLGDFTIYSIAGGGNVSVAANNLYAYNGEKADGSYDDFAQLGYIGGKELQFKVTGDFGEKTNALRVGSGSTIYFEPGVQNLWLHAMEAGNLRINDIQANGIVDILGDDAVTVGVNDRPGGIKGNSVTVNTANALTVNGDIVSNTETLLNSTAGNVTVGGNLTSQGKVALTAGSNAMVDGNIKSANDTVRIVSAAGKIAIGDKNPGSVTGTSVNLDADGGEITVKGNVASTSDSGQVTLDATEAISVVGDITSKGKVALTAGSDASINGNIKSEADVVTILARTGDVSIGESADDESAKGSVTGKSVDIEAQAGRISVNGSVNSSTHAKLAAVNSITVYGNVSGTEAVELVAGQEKKRTQEVGDILVEGTVESTGDNGYALLSATGDITVNGNVTSVGRTTLEAGNGIEVTGEVQSTKNAVEIAAENKGIRVEGDINSKLQTALTAGLDVVIDGNVESKTGVVTVVAENGGITIGEKNAGSVSGQSVALDATSDIIVNGSVTSIGQSSLTAGNGVKVDGTVESSAGQVTVVAQSESIDIEGDIVSNGEDGLANLSAKKDIAITGSITSAKDVRLEAQEGGMTVGTGNSEVKSFITAGGSINISADQKITVWGDVTSNGNVDGNGITMTSKADAIWLDSKVKITAMKDVAMTAAKSVTLEGGVITAGVKATVKAGKEGIDFTKLKLKAADAQITSDGNIKLGAADLTVTNKADIVAAGSLGFADSELTAAEAKLQGVDITATKAVVEATKSIELTATGEGGITAEGGQFKVTTTDETGGNILVDSQGSANLANVDFTINKGDLKIAAQGSVDLKGVDFAIAEGGMTIEAKSGDMDLSGAKGLDMEEIDLSAGGSMAANDLEVTVSKHLNIAAGQDVKAKNIDIKVKGESGDVTFEATKGAVDLANAQIDAAGDGATVGNVSVTAGTEADLTNVFATKEAFTAENLTVKAGGEVTLGNASQSINTTKGSVSIEAANLDGNRLTAGSFIKAADSVSLNLTKAGLTVNDKTDIVAQRNASLVANGDVALVGDILVTGNESVDVKALAGDLDLKGAVTVGDETIAENQANVTLYAKKALTQTTADGDAGVRGKTLTATADGGDLTLAAIEDKSIGSQGNAFEEMTIESEGNVYLGSNGRDTKVTINKDRDGKVNGELKAYGLHNAFEFTNDVSVAGDALIYASAVHGKSLEAGKALQIVTAGFDDEVGEHRLTGVAFTGNLKAQDHVGIFTNTGDIRVDGTTTATDGYIDIYRLTTEDEGTVSMGGGRGGYTISVYNGSGDIYVTDVLYGQDTVYTFTGNGTTKGREYLLSAIHKQAAVTDAQNIGNQIDLEHMKDMTAFELMPELPHLVFDGLALEYADNDRINPFVYPVIDTISPSHEYFFLHLRSDAAANKAAKSEDENESKVLERGLPAKGEGLIRDLRGPTKTETLTVKEDAQGWIVSRAD